MCNKQPKFSMFYFKFIEAIIIFLVEMSSHLMVKTTRSQYGVQGKSESVYCV